MLACILPYPKAPVIHVGHLGALISIVWACPRLIYWAGRVAWGLCLCLVCCTSRRELSDMLNAQLLDQGTVGPQLLYSDPSCPAKMPWWLGTLSPGIMHKFTEIRQHGGLRASWVLPCAPGTRNQLPECRECQILWACMPGPCVCHDGARSMVVLLHPDLYLWDLHLHVGRRIMSSVSELNVLLSGNMWKPAHSCHAR